MLSLQLTVLGCYGPYPPAGGACSGYLLREGDCNLLIDCGNGVLSRLQQHMDYQQLDAVLLSHLHPDHVSDIMIMRYGLVLALNSGLRNQSLQLYACAEPEEEYKRLMYKNAYSVEPLEAEQAIQIGPFSIQTKATVHAVPGLALRIQSSSGTLVYSGDTEYFNGLEAFAAGADLFLCEANFQEQDLSNNLPNHLSASQAAAAAASAEAKRLLLTHHHPDRDRDVSSTEAKKYYPTVEMAVEGETYIIAS